MRKVFVINNENQIFSIDEILPFAVKKTKELGFENMPKIVQITEQQFNHLVLEIESGHNPVLIQSESEVIEGKTCILIDKTKAIQIL